MNNEKNQAKATSQTTDEYFVQLADYVLEQCEGDENKAAEVLRIIRALHLGNGRTD